MNPARSFGPDLVIWDFAHYWVYLYVARDTKEIEDAKPLSPILLVRPLTSAEPLVIADGYHRLCAVYHVDEDAEIPCRIVDQANSDHTRYEHN